MSDKLALMSIARYEYSEGSSNKFWQIELSGTSFTTTFGKIGTPGTTSLKEWPDAATAKKEHDKLVAQKVKKGYQLVGGGAAKPAAKAAPAKKVATKIAAPAGAGGKLNAQLAKQIDANPDDEGAWAVYADWLQSEGDPRGELGVVQERLRASPKDKALLSAEKKLLKDHAAAIVGDLAPYMKKKGHIPGVLTKPDVEPDFRQSNDYGSSGPPVRALWRSGFFQQVFVGHPGFDGFGGGDDDEGGGGGAEEIEMEKLIAKVLSNPAARFLSSLRLGLPNNPEDGECDYGSVVKALAKHEALPRLRTLYVGDITQEESECSWIALGDWSKMWPQLKNLRTLTFRGGSDLKLGSINLPELRSLTIITGGLDKKNVAAISAAKWPKLERLELWFGDDNYGGNCKVKDVAPILAGKAFPKLKHLGLRNCEFIDELAAELPKSAIMRQIDSLDLSKGTLTDDGVKKLAEHKDAFAHLRRLDLSDNYIGKASSLAATITSAVRTKPQRAGDEYVRDDGSVRRYVALSE